MRSNAHCAVGAVIAAAIALTTAGAPAFAAPKASTSVKPIETSAVNTDISSRRYYRGYRYRNNAARAALAGAVIGGAATYAAARAYRSSRYYDGDGYGGGYYSSRTVLDCGPGMNSDGHGNCVPISWRYRY